MQEVLSQMHSELPNPTKLWGYEGQVPGPVIEAERGERVRVKWINELPGEHLLPVDKSLHGASDHVPEVRTVVHLHGAEVEANSDGYPEAWFTRNFQQTGPAFEHQVYEYPNSQRAAALWYHDHALGITRLNVYAGLAGMYIIRDEEERSLNLPSGLFEIPLIISDKGFNEDGSLFYPRNVSDPPPPGVPDPSITPGEAFDFILVNGKVWPFLTVQQRKYRFRILNASNERFYRMSLSSGQPFIQIGSDGGLLESPVELQQITIGPSERLDVIINFSDLPVGARIVLTNDAPTPFDFGEPVDEATTGQIMQFRVAALQGTDTSEVPSVLSSIERFQASDAAVIRDVTLDVGRDQFNRLKFLLSNQAFMDGITEKPRLNDIEMWRIINQGIAVHPIHIHLIQFQILDRIPFDVAAFNATGQLRFTGEPQLPSPGEMGWKDTVLAMPGFVTRLMMRFAPYTGRYVYHCHILEHEDNDMMRPFEVINPTCRCRECTAEE